MKPIRKRSFTPVTRRARKRTWSFTVTKETKTIDGHLCKKVIARNEEGTWTAWVAQDIPTPFADLLRSMRQPASRTGSSHGTA
ncbi:MAG: hypothetical protein IPF78_11575 [Flavobacteriales bacterium]|nr:hypothetical protein [Flavobacteriales bacterium]